MLRSLVGSEMCIRDRLNPLHPSQGTSKPPHLYTMESENRVREDRRAKIAAGLVFLGAAGVALLVAIIAHNDEHSAPGMYNNPKTNRSSPIGWIAVSASVVVFGSYGILMKAPDVQDAKVDTMVFQCYSSIGISAVSVLVLTYAPWHFSWWGIAGGSMLVLIQVFAFNAISALGYAVAPAIWAGLTIVVSFLWGTLKFGESVDSMVGAVFSLVLLVCGVMGVASCQTELPVRLAASFGLCASDLEPSLLEPANPVACSDEQVPKLSKATGAVFCVVVGLLNGSLMVPFHYLSQEIRSDQPPVTYLGSFALGVLVTTPLFVVFYFYFPVRDPPVWHFQVAAVPGILTGALWGFGNFFATYATQYLGNTVGFPLTQGCIIFNGLWGIFFYREISGNPKIVMFGVCATVIIGGAVLLTISKGS
eukprot:TRINITY_DN45368_c0_g1_i1.p1 TRINITY_DN45368_c0_g1~~TRINITY_DN45368_c0_g1_i1.p1  ORF type:complete len:444 (-),score=107.99 TRINITY_DN45368_c0_g1_i1:217-1476(-)